MQGKNGQREYITNTARRLEGSSGVVVVVDGWSYSSMQGITHVTHGVEDLE
jgi:hypothetical protein